jgi:hypothetical protein
MKGVEQAALWAMLFVGLYWAACNCNHDGHMYRGPSHLPIPMLPLQLSAQHNFFVWSKAGIYTSSGKIFSSSPSIFRVHAKHITPLDFTKP